MVKDGIESRAGTSKFILAGTILVLYVDVKILRSAIQFCYTTNTFLWRALNGKSKSNQNDNTLVWKAFNQNL